MYPNPLLIGGFSLIPQGDGRWRARWQYESGEQREREFPTADAALDHLHTLIQRNADAREQRMRDNERTQLDNAAFLATLGL